MKKVNFLITTLFGMRFPNYLDNVVRLLIAQCEYSNIPYNIHVAGRKNEHFDKWNNEKVTKGYMEYSNEDVYETAFYINDFVSKLPDNEYFCYFHDDLMIDDYNWLTLFDVIYRDEKLNCGAIGVLSHSNSIIKMCAIGLYKCLYTNGAMLTTTELMKEIKFNPDYRYECGDMDFCYELVHRGYNNYLIGVPYRHYMSPYNETFKNLKNINEKLVEDRIRFNNKWKEKMPVKFMESLK